MPKKKRRLKSFDYEPEIEEAIKEFAEELGVPINQVRNLLMAEGILDLQQGKGSIWSRLRPSKSPRYKSNIDIDDLLKRLGRKD